MENFHGIDLTRPCEVKRKGKKERQNLNREASSFKLKWKAIHGGANISNATFLKIKNLTLKKKNENDKSRHQMKGSLLLAW